MTQARGRSLGQPANKESDVTTCSTQQPAATRRPRAFFAPNSTLERRSPSGSMRGKTYRVVRQAFASARAEPQTLAIRKQLNNGFFTLAYDRSLAVEHYRNTHFSSTQQRLYLHNLLSSPDKYPKNLLNFERVNTLSHKLTTPSKTAHCDIKVLN